jgi:hypothetical protein
MKKSIQAKARAAIITAGDDRGFVISAPSGNLVDRFVVTAAHCLPKLPPRIAAMYSEEKTYPDFLGPLGEKPSVWAECLFVNPVDDIAVLGSPDNQTFFQESDDYEALIESTTPIRIAEAPENGRGWLFSLEGEWFPATLEYFNDGPFWVSKTAQPIAAGMSGSPIVSDGGAAIGIAALATLGSRTEELSSQNPRLTRDLPGWLLRTCQPRQSRNTSPQLRRRLPKLT